MPFCRSSIRQIKIKIKLVASFAFGYLVRGHTQLVNRSGCDSVIFVFIVTARAEESLAAFYDVFVLLLFGSFVAALTHCPRLSVALIFLLFFSFNSIHSLGLDQMLMSVISLADARTLTSKNSHRPTT